MAKKDWKYKQKLKNKLDKFDFFEIFFQNFFFQIKTNQHKLTNFIKPLLLNMFWSSKLEHHFLNRTFLNEENPLIRAIFIKTLIIIL